jgi:hypothetical protein
MTCSSCVIIGDGPIITEVMQRVDLVAPFRQARFEQICDQYQKDENSITADEAVFVLICAIDVIQNQQSP